MFHDGCFQQGWLTAIVIAWSFMLEVGLLECEGAWQYTSGTNPISVGGIRPAVEPRKLIVKNRWTVSRQTAALQPAGRASHAAATILYSVDNDTVRETMLVFGGVTKNDMPFDPQTWLYQPVDNAWFVLQADSPSVRFGHAMLTGPAGDYVLLLGGCCLEANSSDYEGDDIGATEMYTFRDMSWRRVFTNQTGFHNRFLHSAVVVPHYRSNVSARNVNINGRSARPRQLLVFGGAYCVEQEGDEVNDLWQLSYSDDELVAAETEQMSMFPRLQWRQVKPAGSTPQPRAGHVGVSTFSDTMLVFGGYSNATMLSDLWEYDPSTECWTQLSSLPWQDIQACTSLTGAYMDGIEVLIISMACSPVSSLVTFLYSYRSQSWQELTPLGLQMPDSLSFPSLTIVDEQLLLYGGRDADGITTSDVWVLIHQGNFSVWAVQPTPKRLPPPRALHAAAFCPVVNAMFVIGGFAVEAAANGGVQGTVFAKNVMWKWNATWDQWTYQPVPLSFKPRVAAAMDIVNAVLVVFGGFSENMSSLNDTWRVCTVTLRWMCSTSAVVPTSRGAHSIVSTDTTIIMFGGFNTHTNEALNDVCLYRVDLDSWTCKSCDNMHRTACILPRFGHSAALVDNDMYVFGGVVPRAASEPDYRLWRYNLRNNIWQIASGSSQSLTPAPAARFFFTMTAVGKKLVVLGGCSEYDVATTSVDEWYTSLPVFCYENRQELDSAFVFDTTKGSDGEWSFPLALSNTPPMYMQSTAVLYHESLIIYGGIGYQFIYNGSLGGDERWMITLGCNSGSASRSFPNLSCEECDKNSFAESSGMSSCTRCPVGTFAELNRSISVKNCSLCDAQTTCFGHGRCVVEAGYRLSCICHFGYSPSDKCQMPIYYMIGAGGGVIVIIAVLLTLVSVKYRRKKRAEADKEHMLACSRQEITELTTVWQIDPEELIIKHRIDRSPGSFGQVFLAEYRGFPVAMKKLSPVVFTPESGRDFEREVETMRKIRHPNIVLFLGGGHLTDANGLRLPFIVMEYLQRGTLRNILDDGTIHIDHVQQLRFAMDIARGMRFLHSLTPPRLHRDLKSANTLVSDRWVVKVTDFGSSTRFDLTDVTSSRSRAPGSLVRASSVNLITSDVDATETTPLLHTQAQLSSRVGTVAWSAPELLAGRSYGASVDVYSYGIVLWEILTRQLPFKELKFTVEILAAVRAGQRPKVPQGSPLHYTNLMQACWTEDHRQRPTFAEIVPQLDEQLEKWLSQISHNSSSN